ncbi:hypothetical protein WJX72_002328 [[Myrmecia] bisecta]|uniref:Cysteine protease n=1 Tax=[Myrmecia] bisecta TaxID=41462 RepID=A0AAW1PL59_9CHLO
MAQALGLKKLQDFFQGASSLPPSASPLYLLGVQYKNTGKATDAGCLEADVQDAVRADCASRIWMTYRRDFSPLGSSGLTSDVGWGCTLRSGQMLLAEGLLRHLLGRSWRRDPASLQVADVVQILSLFWDSPAAQHAFSVHNLCLAGAPHGVKVGEWLGPWVLCRTLETVVNRVAPSGLYVHVVASASGGAPVLYTQRLQQLFKGTDGQGASGSSSSALTGLLVLVPLTLGIGKVNPRYIPQLQAVLGYPHSIGIVGGRPSSSLYFIGCQEDSVIFLDPHEVQEAAASPEDPASYWCTSLRSMALANIDPSLAIGFYCRSPAGLQDLCQRLALLEKQSAGAPLLSVLDGEPVPDFTSASLEDFSLQAAESSSSDAAGRKGDEWELL